MPSDPLDDFPKIRLEEDDLASFHRTRGRASQSATTSSTDEDQGLEPVKVKNSGPSWLAFIFLLMVLAAGGGYWSYLQFKVLQQAQSRITELESRLSATGEDMDQSAAALQVKVSELSNKTAELWEQMDKLWASAWRRNQAEIGELNKSLTAFRTKSESLQQNLNNEVAQNNTSLSLVSEQIEKQTTTLQQLSTKVAQISQADADTQQQLASLREKIIATALANNDLINQIDDLRRRIAANEKKTKEVERILIGPTS
ncbi:hypothetical protein [Paraglaciecola aestuariivivens]